MKYSSIISLLNRYYRLFILGILVFSLHGCPSSLIDAIDPIDTGVFSPSLVWLRPSIGTIMDVSPVGNIVSIGDTVINSQPYTTIQTFSPDGILLHRRENSGYSHEVVANYSDPKAYTLCKNFPNGNSVLSTYFAFVVTNPYARYNTQTGLPATQGTFNIIPFRVIKPRFRRSDSCGCHSLDGQETARRGVTIFHPKGNSTIGPSIAKAAKEVKFLYEGQYENGFSAAWMIGSFYDKFQPFQGPNGFQNSCPSFGKADCFIIRKTEYLSAFRIPFTDTAPFHIPVRHQWGGTENDLAYDVASDTAGNATIFLRAGSDFAITSATQTLVRMKTGYNIVRLDTNGLLTATFPVRLDAQGEISDAKIALAPKNVVYILAKDEQKKQYFLAKTTPNGTEWQRYFSPSVSTGITYLYGYFSRMDLATDSKGNVFVTGSFYNQADFGSGKVLPDPNGTTAFVAKYSPANECIGATALGAGTGITIRLSPQEDALYVNGWGGGPIMGVNIPDPNAGLPTRLREFRSPAFLVKLKLK